MRRGQAIVELALGILVLVPMVLFGFYLLEAANEKLVVTKRGTDALFAQTAYSHHTYESASFHSPSAASSAAAMAMAQYLPKHRLFVDEKSVQISCQGSGQGIAFPVASTAAFYRDLGGSRCRATTTIEAKFLPSSFAEGGTGFFQEPLTRIRRVFRFCETDACTGFTMLVDDWGLTRDNNEGAECEVSSAATGGCQNQGFFNAGAAVYDSHRTGAGTQSTADSDFVDGILRGMPNGLLRTKEYQMSFRGEESMFTEVVDVNEGKPDWVTTPYDSPSQQSHAARKEDFLGK